MILSDVKLTKDNVMKALVETNIALWRKQNRG